jgi:AbiJ N-terminal domain 4
MSITDLYSKRKKRIEKGSQPEVYQYDELPLAFRRKVIYIWCDAIGVYQTESYFGYAPRANYQLWTNIYNLLNRELSLSDPRPFLSPDPFGQCKEFLLNKDTHFENLLDLIELTFRVIDEIIRKEIENPHFRNEWHISQSSYQRAKSSLS